MANVPNLKLRMSRIVQNSSLTIHPDPFGEWAMSERWEASCGVMVVRQTEEIGDVLMWLLPQGVKCSAHFFRKWLYMAVYCVCTSYKSRKWKIRNTLISLTECFSSGLCNPGKRSWIMSYGTWVLACIHSIPYKLHGIKWRPRTGMLQVS